MLYIISININIHHILYCPYRFELLFSFSCFPLVILAIYYFSGCFVSFPYLFLSFSNTKKKFLVGGTKQLPSALFWRWTENNRETFGGLFICRSVVEPQSKK